MCDANGDGMLSKKEINDCIDEYVPDSDQEEAHEEVDEHFAEADTNGDGKLSKKELKAAFASLAQLKQSLAQVKQGPSPADVINMCDANGDGMLSKKEINDCIDEYVPESDQEEAHEEVDEHFADVDVNGDGKLSKKELKAAFASLAQIKQGPSPSDVIDMCDANGDGMLSKKEINDCIDEYVPESDQEEAHEEVDEHFADVDVNGDGKLSKKELKAAFSSLAQVKQGLAQRRHHHHLAQRRHHHH